MVILQKWTFIYWSYKYSIIYWLLVEIYYTKDQ